MSRFTNEITAPEARNFYALQGAMENIHGQVYSLLIDTLIKDPERKKYLFNAIDEIPCVAKKEIFSYKMVLVYQMQYQKYHEHMNRNFDSLDYTQTRKSNIYLYSDQFWWVPFSLFIKE